MRERASREQQKEKEINEISFVASSWSRRDSRQQTDGWVGGFVLPTVLGNRYLYLYNTQFLIFFCSFSERERKSRESRATGSQLTDIPPPRLNIQLNFQDFFFFFSFLNAKRNRIAYTHTRTFSREWWDFLLPFRLDPFIFDLLKIIKFVLEGHQHRHRHRRRCSRWNLFRVASLGQGHQRRTFSPFFLSSFHFPTELRTGGAPVVAVATSSY